MSDTVMLSEGVSNVLQMLRSHSRPETNFPVGLSAAATRRASGETLRQWFKRLVHKYCSDKEYCSDKPGRVAIEENIAIFASLEWGTKDKKDLLRFASMSVLIAPCDLDTFLKKDCEATCLRLDVNCKTLGFPFSHPLAHVHVEGSSQLRFALDGGIAGNVVLDYLEFIYRTFVPIKWERWARKVWLSHRDDEATFNQIVTAFKENQFSVLREYAAPISELKKLLRKAKDSAFKGYLSSVDREILEYPAGR